MKVFAIDFRSPCNGEPMAVVKESGGATAEVGAYGAGPTMRAVDWDEKTRPMTRADFIAMATDGDRLSAEEKRIMTNGAIMGAGGCMLAYIGGKRMASWAPWQVLEHRYPGFKTYRPWAIRATGVQLAFIPYVLSQSYLTRELLALDERDGHLFAWELKRYLIAQRGTMLWGRHDMREITKRDQEKLLKKEEDLAFKAQREVHGMGDVSGEGRRVNVDLALGKQQLTPFAQSGYKDPNAVK